MAFLEDAYAYATECNLATLSELHDIKSSSKSRIGRQTRICAQMLEVCRHIDEKIDWRPVGDAGSSRYLRTYELLQTGLSTKTQFEAAIEKALADNIL
jgi:hypothetical protein